MTTENSEPQQSRGSTTDGIDSDARLRAADKQLRIAGQAADTAWLAEAIHALRADLARLRGDDYQRASELHTGGIRAHREGQTDD